jgi:hypothetical protein
VVDTLVIVTHGEFLNRLLQRLFRLEDPSSHSFMSDNTSAAHVLIESRGPGTLPLATLRVLNAAPLPLPKQAAV